MQLSLPQSERMYWLKRNFVFAIAEARYESGLTQVQLAAKIGRSQSFVSKSENIAWNPKLNALIELMDGLGLELQINYQQP